MNRTTRTTLSAMLLFAVVISGCRKDEDDPPTTTPQADPPSLIVKFRFDSTQARLNNLGQPAPVPSGNAGITPQFNGMSSHYIELAPGMLTALGNGEIIYSGPSTSAGGDPGVDFDQAIIGAENETILSIPLSSITPGTYEWVRSSLTYQNYDIPFRSAGYDLIGTVASFVGFNTYITNYTIDQESIAVNDDKLQGYWGFETHDDQLPFTVAPITGQAPPGATTVPNPLFATSPIPQGSCVVTGELLQPLTITGNETSDIVLVLSVSIKQSFEFTDANGNGIYEPDLGETVVDMGVRGLVPYTE
jgi:hypothetical protein